MRHATKIVAPMFALAGALVTGCSSTPQAVGGGPLPTPAFVQLQTLNTNATWSTEWTCTILPAPGHAVRISFSAATGSAFSVSLRAPDGTVTPLPQQQAVPPPSEQGYFPVVSMDTTASPPV